MKHPARKILATFLSLMALLSLGRILFFIGFHPPTLLQEQSWGSVVYVFGMALRFDLSIASLLVAPAFVVSLVWHLFQKNPSQKFMFFLSVWKGFVGMISIGMVVIAHYYYFYYNDTFSVDFWEFWVSLENSKLVLASIPHEIPMIQCLFLTVGLIAFFSLVSWKLEPILHYLPKSLDPFSRLWKTAMAALLLTVGARGTLWIPLTIQRETQMVSENIFLNRLNSNAFYDLHSSWRLIIYGSSRKRDALIAKATSEDVQQAFEDYASLAPGRSVTKNPKGISEIRYQVQSIQSQFLKRKPKHIVILFMESQNGWIYQTELKKYCPELPLLAEHSVSFNHYFQAGFDTLQNIFKANLSVETPSKFPLEISFSDAFKPFPHTLPRLMKEQRFDPRFFYGGSLEWHHLHKLLKSFGYEKIFGEHHMRTKFSESNDYFGVYDEDLFKYLNESLKTATEPTFNFVMTLSNHPPYVIPKNFQLPKGFEFPADLQPHVKDVKSIRDRLRGHFYADWALGQFFQQAQKEAYFKDTLFVITADHSMNRNLSWEGDLLYRSKKIPLLFYAPDLLKEPEQQITTAGSHLDLTPTLMSLVSDKDLSLTLWGKNLFAPEVHPLVHGFKLDCIGMICKIYGQSYQIDPKYEKSVLCPTEDEACRSSIQQIEQGRKGADLSGLSYFFNWKP